MVVLMRWSQHLTTCTGVQPWEEKYVEMAEAMGIDPKVLECSLIPRPSPASCLVAYVTFEPPSDKRGSKVTYATKNEAGESAWERG